MSHALGMRRKRRLHAAGVYFISMNEQRIIISRIEEALSSRNHAVLIEHLLVSEHKVIIVGLDNAGKTTILYQLCVIVVRIDC